MHYTQNHATFPFSETYALPWQVSVVIGRLYIHDYIVEHNVPCSRLYTRIYEAVICSTTPEYSIQVDRIVSRSPWTDSLGAITPIGSTSSVTHTMYSTSNG